MKSSSKPLLGTGSSVTYHLVAFVVVAIWGSTFVSTKMLLLAGLSPAQIFTLRFIIAYVLLLAYSLIMQKGRGKSFLLFSKCWQDEVLMFALGGSGRHRRYALFPDRELCDELHHDD